MATAMEQAKPIRKQDWCISAIISVVFGGLTAIIFYHIVLFGAGSDGYAVIFCIFTAPVAIVFGLWGLFYWRSAIAVVGLLLGLSPLVYLNFF